MRIIYLNVWQGKVWDKFLNFIQKQKDLTDIFCFQEISPDLFLKISRAMPGYCGHHDVGGEYYPHNLWYGQAIFVKKDIKTSVSKKAQIFQEDENKIGFVQYLSSKQDNRAVFVGNVHGNPHPGNKLDTPFRIIQSRKIIKLFKNKNGLKIIGGDFNLLPQTKSITLFEKAGYRNLIREFNIKATRNKLSWEVHSKEGGYFVKQYYADYLFVSPDVKVSNLKVPDIEISDHLPLILDFEI